MKLFGFSTPAPVVPVWHGDHLPVFADVARSVGVTKTDTYRGALVGFWYGYEAMSGQQGNRGWVQLESSAYSAVSSGDFDAVTRPGAFETSDAVMHAAMGKKEEHPEVENFGKRYVITMFHANGRRGRCVYSQMVYCRTVFAMNGIDLPKESDLRGEYAGPEWVEQLRIVLSERGMEVNHPVVGDYFAVSSWLEDAVETNLASGKLTLPLLNLRHHGGWTELVK